MSDDNIKTTLSIDVDVTDLEKAEALRKELGRIDAELRSIAKNTTQSFRNLGNLASSIGKVKGPSNKGTADPDDAAEGELNTLAELKKRWSFERRMNAQRRSEEGEAARAARTEAQEVERRFRDQLAFNTRIAAQRAREEQAAESAIQKAVRETGKIRDEQARAAVKTANEARRAEERRAAEAKRDAAKGVTNVTQGAGRVRAGTGRAVGVTGAAGIGAGYATERAIGALTRSGVDLDRAVNSNIRLSGLSPRDAETKGKELVQKVAPVARQLGIKTSEYLAARAEAIQAGVDEALVDSVTEFGSKFARLNDIAPSQVMEYSGYGITALSAFGQVTGDKVKELFNIQQHLAATTAASRQGINSFVKRGLSAGAAAGFSLPDTLAYGGAATSSGADGESAARMLSSTTERLASMPTRAADIARKKHKSIKDRNILSIPRKLGMGSWKDIKQAFSQDAAGTIEKIYEGLAAIHDPRERLEASEEIWGREFGSVHAGMAVGHRFKEMRKSVRSPEAGNAIDKGMDIRSGSFDFIMYQITSTFQSMKDGLGMVLKPFWSDLRDWAMKAPRAFESFNEAFREAIKGFLTGIGSPDGTMAGLLNHWFGDPGSFTVNARAIGDFARGVGQGLRDIGNAITSFVKVFAGRNATPEELGRWTARIAGLAAALLVAAPALAVITALGTAISGFVGIILGAYRLLRAAGVAGGTAAGAGGAGAAAGAGLLGTLSRLFPAIAAPLTMDPSREDRDRLQNRLGRWALDGEQQGVPGGIPQRARGGFVFGPGTSTSDSIMARLSNGEFVVNADAAYRHRGLLEAINSNAPGFARGGSVGGGGYNPESLFPAPAFSDGLLKRLAVAVEELVVLTKNDLRNGTITRRMNDLVRQLGSPVGGGGGAPAMQRSVGQSVIDGVRDRAVAATAVATPGGGYQPGSGLGTMPRNGIIGRGSGSNPAPEGPTTPVPGALNPRLAGSRKALMDELDRDPALRQDVLKTVSMENRGSPEKMQAVMESMVNRAKMRGYTSLRQSIHDGFYGPVNRGGLSGALSERDRQNGEAALAKVRAGSNMIGYRTDQGMLTDPGARRYMQEPDRSGHRVIGGENYFYMGQRGRRWAQQQKAADAAAGSGGGGATDGGNPARGADAVGAQAAQGLAQSRGHYTSQIDVEGRSYDYGTGGNRGARSIPVGTYKVTPDALGPWGRRNGSIGINGGQIWDATQGRMRTGIQMHAASNARMITSGCLGIARQQYGAFKAHVMDVIRRQGSAYLTVGEDGRATISGGAAGAAAAAATAAAGGGRGTQAARRSIDETGEVANRLNQSPVGQNRQDDAVMRPGNTPNPQGNITSQVPMPRAGGPGQNEVGPMSQRGGLGGGGGVNLTIHAAHLEAEAMANAVERRLGDAMRRRAHDTDYGWG